MEIAKNHERFSLRKCVYISQNIENNSHSMLSKIKNETWKRSHNFSKTYVIDNVVEKRKNFAYASRGAVVVVILSIFCSLLFLLPLKNDLHRHYMLEKKKKKKSRYIKTGIHFVANDFSSPHHPISSVRSFFT